MRDLLLRRRTGRCRGRQVRSLSLSIALLIAPQIMAMQCAPGGSGVIVQGYTFGSMQCDTTVDGGVKFSAAISQFRPSASFHYRFNLYYNGAFMFGDISPTFWTTSEGSHNSMPTRYFGCGHGTYRLDIWAETSDGKYHTSISTRTATC
jgi:hypothetical protein